MPVLTMTPCLLLMLILSLGGQSDGLLVGHLGDFHPDIDAKFAQHLVRSHLKLGFTDTRKDGLQGIGVAAHLKGVVFFS